MHRSIQILKLIFGQSKWYILIYRLNLDNGYRYFLDNVPLVKEIAQQYLSTVLKTAKREKNRQNDRSLFIGYFKVTL